MSLRFSKPCVSNFTAAADGVGILSAFSNVPPIEAMLQTAKPPIKRHKRTANNKKMDCLFLNMVYL